MSYHKKAMSYTVRTECIFCKNTLNTTYFENDYSFPVTQYQINIDDKLPVIDIPFNVCICSKCNTAQTKYLGDLSDIYKINHADSTSRVMKELHVNVCEIVSKYSTDIRNIIEIGFSFGILSDMILERNPNIKYYVVEPSFCGDRSNKTIIDDYYENIDDSNIDANTMIISHVFEHFFKPLDILDKIRKNSGIEHFFLIFPNLEHCMHACIPHFLHSEHTYYIDNTFLVKLCELYGFALVEQKYHKEHSVIFYFRRKTTNVLLDNGVIRNSDYSLDRFYSNIRLNVEYFNQHIYSVCSEHKIYIWPAAIHTIYLCKIGLSYKQIHGMLDNSPHKIGKKMHCIDLPIYSFSEILSMNAKNTTVILYGGFNIKEITTQIETATNITFIYPK